MMKELRFYREKNGTWWVWLPDYITQGGAPGDLQMVCGADDMLDLLSEGKDEVTLEVSREKAKGHLSYTRALRRVDEIPTSSGRYYYDDETELLMWLCDVTLWIFGEFPEILWYKKL